MYVGRYIYIVYIHIYIYIYIYIFIYIYIYIYIYSYIYIYIYIFIYILYIYIHITSVIMYTGASEDQSYIEGVKAQNYMSHDQNWAAARLGMPRPPFRRVGGNTFRV